jgi:hypothetical protein
MSVDLVAATLKAARLRFDGARPRRLGRITTIAFDDFVQSDTAVATAVTYPSLNDLLGGFDQLAVETSVDQVSAGVGPASLDVHLGHSGNGLWWTRKETSPLTRAATLSSTGKTYLDIGHDDGTRPSLGHIRLELTLSAVAGPVRARVRVHVTANNVREKEFALAVKDARGPTHNVYDRCYPAGSRVSMASIKVIVQYWRYYGQLRVDLERWAAIVPRDQMVCFNAFGESILVDRGKVVVSSRGVIDYYIDQAGRGGGPPRRAEDPKPEVTLGYGDDT